MIDFIHIVQCQSEHLLQTFVALALVVAVWLMFSIVIESSGFFTPSNPASFEKNLTMKVGKAAC
jgi:hypothetical protein